MPKYPNLNKILPFLESAPERSIYNKSALDTLRSSADEETRLLEALAATDKAPLQNTQLADQLKGLKLEGLPENAGQFQLVGEPIERGFTLGESGPISRVPAVIEKEAEKFLPAKRSVDDVIEGDTLSPKLDRAKNLPLTEAEERLAKYRQYMGAATLGTAAGVGSGLMSSDGGDFQTPPSQAVLPSTSTSLPSSVSTIPEVRKEDVPTDTEKVLSRLAAMASRPSAEEAVPTSEIKDINFGEGTSEASLQRYKDLLSQIRDANTVNTVARDAVAAASGMAGVKNQFDESFKDQAAANVQQGDNYLKQVQFEKEDPNSPMSQGYKEIAKRMGFNIKGTASAADLERLFPQFSNIYNQEQARIARASDAKMNREQRLAELQLRLAQAKEMRKLQLDDKGYQRKNQFIEYAQKSLNKEFEKYKTLENAFQSLEQAKGDKTGPGDVAILYNFIKSLDPNSVVREGEIALGRQGMSLAGRLQTMTLGKFSGEMLSPKFRQDILKIAGRLKNQGNTTYNEMAQTIRDTGQQRYNMSDDELTLIDPLLNRTAKQRKKAPIDSNAAIQLKPEDVDKLSDEEVEAELKRRGL